MFGRLGGNTVGALIHQGDGRSDCALGIRQTQSEAPPPIGQGDAARIPQPFW
jgi:hypothetical protein